MSRRRTIAYLVPHSELAGGERVILDLSARLDPAKFRPIVILPREGGLARQLRQQSVHVEVCFFRRDLVGGFPPAWSGRAFRQITEILRKESVDVLHLNDSYLALLGGRAGRRMNIPVGLTAHGPWDAHFFVQDLLNRRYVARAWPPSAHVAQALTRRKIYPTERVRIVPFGVDLNRFSESNDPTCREKLNIPSDAVVIIRIARFDVAKDYPTFLKAANELAQRHSNVFFLALGDKQLEVPSETDSNKAAFLGFLDEHPLLKSRVRWMGHQEDVPFYLAASDILVSSSLSESFPINLLEAMAMGRPVVSTDVGATSAIVNDGKTGRLVPRGNPEALADALTSLVVDPFARKRMGEQGRERAFQEFNLKTFVSSMEREYEHLMNGRP